MRRLAGRLTMILAIGLLVVTPSALAAGTNSNANGKSTTELLSIESDYVCLSCHEPLELVSSPQALSEKAFLLQLIEQGHTPAEIKKIMVAQYGVAVLAKPPASGFNLTVYILPPLLLVCGLGMLAYTLPKWRERSRRAASTPMSSGGAAALSADDSARLDDELDRLV